MTTVPGIPGESDCSRTRVIGGCGTTQPGCWELNKGNIYF